MAPDNNNVPNHKRADPEEAAGIVADRGEVPALACVEPLFTVEEAAKVLNVAPTWIYERTRKDAIPFRRFGKYVRFTKSDLHEIIVNGSCGPRNAK